MTEKSDFSVAVTEDREAPVVVITGELDMSQGDEAWAVIKPLVRSARTGLTVDLAGVTFIDSRGLNVLVRALQELDGVPLTIRSAPQRIVRLLEVSGLAELVVLT